MKIKKEIHPIYKEMDKKNIDIKMPIGRMHYIYTGKKGKISLISLPNYFMDNKTLWEIYCLGGNIFEDVKRFDTKVEAEKYIKKIID